MKFQKGDKVQVIEGQQDYGLTLNTVYTVTRSYRELGEEYVTVSGPSYTQEGLYPSRFELAPQPNPTSPFKVGDKVQLDSPHGVGALQPDTEYTVTRVEKDFIYLEGLDQFYFTKRFKPFAKRRLRVGDKVTVIAGKKNEDVKYNRVYTIKYVPKEYIRHGEDHALVELEEISGGVYAYRFELAKPANLPKINLTKPPIPTNTTPMKTPKRDARGRFAPIGGSVTPTKAQNFAVLPTLKRGSLYRVNGGAVGRYSGGDTVIKGVEFVTMSIHGKAQAVPKERVRLASKEDVTAYLEDASA